MNNKLRKCSGVYYATADGRFGRQHFENGDFHGWGMRNNDDNGTMHSVGIVEMEDGNVILVDAENIKFLESESE